MSNKRRLAVMGLSAVLCLSACGEAEENTRGLRGDVVTEDPGEAQPTAAEETGTPGGEEQPTEAQGPVGTSEEDGFFAEAFAKGQVENNGGYFVRVGDKVYYRVYSETGLHRTALFGSFIDGDIPTAPSSLMSYDLKTGKQEEIATVYGNGKLYVGTKGFFLGNSDTNETYLISPTGAGQNLYCSGVPNGVSEDGRILEVTQYPYGGTPFYGEVVVRDGKEIAQISSDGMTGVYFCGYAGQYAILVSREEDADAWKLYSIDENGKQTELGAIEVEDDWISYLVPEPEQILYDEEGVYLSFGYYDGTGHMLADWAVVSAKPGVADSLTMLEAESRADNIDVDQVPRMLLTGPGEVEMYSVAGGEVGLSEGYYGDLVYYDSPFGATMLKEDLIPKEEAEGAADWCSFLLDAVVFDDTAFLITAYGERNEQQDIGWRMAYDLVYLEYYNIPFDAAHLENGVPKEMNSMEFVTSDGWAEGAVDYEDLVGKWELYSFETEGYCGTAEEDGIDTHLTFQKDGTVILEEKVEGVNEKREFTKLTGDEENVFISMDEDDEDNVMQLEILSCSEDQLEVFVSFWYADAGGSDWIFRKE